MKRHLNTRRALVIGLCAALQACDSPAPTDLETLASPADASEAQSWTPAFPAAFVSVVDNPLHPLIPGTIRVYESETDEGTEEIVVEVTQDTKVILGVSTTVVRDRVYLDGELIEDTYDWFAQDSEGNVWYLGEDTCEYEDGECVSTAGSFEAGVDGAEAGIVMWSDPGSHVGKTYRQEYYEGVAEDTGKVLRLNVSVDVAYGSFTGCLETMDWTPLEPGAREHKFYCPGIGLVLEVSPSGGRSRQELVDVTEP